LKKTPCYREGDMREKGRGLDLKFCPRVGDFDLEIGKIPSLPAWG